MAWDLEPIVGHPYAPSSLPRVLTSFAQPPTATAKPFPGDVHLRRGKEGGIQTQVTLFFRFLHYFLVLAEVYERNLNGFRDFGCYDEQ